MIGGGVIVVLGEMDVALAEPSRPGCLPVHKATALHPINQRWSPPGPLPPHQPSITLTWWTTSTRPGLQRASGYGGWVTDRVKKGSIQSQITLDLDWKQNLSRCSKRPKISCSDIKIGFSCTAESKTFVSLVHFNDIFVFAEAFPVSVVS